MSTGSIPITGRSIAAFEKKLIQGEKNKPRVQCCDRGRLVLRLAQGAETLGQEESAQLANFFGVPELDGEAFYQSLLPENMNYDYGEIRFTLYRKDGCCTLLISAMTNGIGSVNIRKHDNLTDGASIVQAAQENSKASLRMSMAFQGPLPPAPPPTPEEIKKGQECQQRINRIVHPLYADGGD